jgi:hypothetical protein
MTTMLLLLLRGAVRHACIADEPRLKHPRRTQRTSQSTMRGRHKHPSCRCGAVQPPRVPPHRRATNHTHGRLELLTTTRRPPPRSTRSAHPTPRGRPLADVNVHHSPSANLPHITWWTPPRSTRTDDRTRTSLHAARPHQAAAHHQTTAAVLDAHHLIDHREDEHHLAATSPTRPEERRKSLTSTSTIERRPRPYHAHMRRDHEEPPRDAKEALNTRAERRRSERERERRQKSDKLRKSEQTIEQAANFSKFSILPLENMELFHPTSPSTASPPRFLRAASLPARRPSMSLLIALLTRVPRRPTDTAAHVAPLDHLFPAACSCSTHERPTASHTPRSPPLAPRCFRRAAAVGTTRFVAPACIAACLRTSRDSARMRSPITAEVDKHPTRPTHTTSPHHALSPHPHRTMPPSDDRPTDPPRTLARLLRRARRACCDHGTSTARDATR